MNTAAWITLGTAVAAGLSALFAGASAWATRASVRLANRPWVWPEVDGLAKPSGNAIAVRVANLGAGVAHDVRVAVVESDASSRGEPSPAIRAMRPGDVVPAAGVMPAIPVALPPDPGEEWTLVVRYTDAGGVRWEYREPRTPAALATGPDPLRARWWQLQRPPADW